MSCSQHTLWESALWSVRCTVMSRGPVSWCALVWFLEQLWDDQGYFIPLYTWGSWGPGWRGKSPVAFHSCLFSQLTRGLWAVASFFEAMIVLFLKQPVVPTSAGREAEGWLPSLSVFPAVWCSERPGEGARLQGRALWLHPVTPTEILPSVYPWGAELGPRGTGFPLCVDPGLLRMGHLQRGEVLPQPRTVSCQDETVYMFLVFKILQCWYLKLINFCLFFIAFYF